MPTPPISALTERPDKVISVTFGGKFFRCSQRTYGALLHAQSVLARKHPGAYILVLQGCYHTGYAPSAGTHDFDACLDVKIIGLTWEQSQRFWRELGWAAWWRHTGAWASPSTWHIHMALLGAPAAGCTVGKYVDGGMSLYGRIVGSSQYDDYRDHRDGLASHAPDPTWHPANIPGTIYSYNHWLEDNMPLTDKDVNRIADTAADKVIKRLNLDTLAQRVANKAAASVLDSEVGPPADRVPVRTAIYRASNVPDLVRRVRDAVTEAMK